MNNQRRKLIKEQIAAVDELIEVLDDATGDVNDIASEVNDIQSEEEDAFDNLSEGAQDGDRGAKMEEAIENLSSFDSEMDSVNSLIFDAIETLKTAKSYLSDALA